MLKQIWCAFGVFVAAALFSTGTASAADPAGNSSAAGVNGPFYDLDGESLAFPIDVEERSGEDNLTATVEVDVAHDMKGRLTGTNARITGIVSDDLGALNGDLACASAKGTLRAKRTETSSWTRLKAKFVCSGTLKVNPAGGPQLVVTKATLTLDSRVDHLTNAQRSKAALKIAGQASVVGVPGVERVRGSFKSLDETPGLPAVLVGADAALAFSLPSIAATAKTNQFASPAASVRIGAKSYDAPATGKYNPKKDESLVKQKTVQLGGKVTLSKFRVDAAGAPQSGTALFSIKGHKGKLPVVALP